MYLLPFSKIHYDIIFGLLSPSPTFWRKQIRQNVFQHYPKLNKHLQKGPSDGRFRPIQPSDWQINSSITTKIIKIDHFKPKIKKFPSQIALLMFAHAAGRSWEWTPFVPDNTHPRNHRSASLPQAVDFARRIHLLKKPLRRS